MAGHGTVDSFACIIYTSKSFPNPLLPMKKLYPHKHTPLLQADSKFSIFNFFLFRTYNYPTKFTS